MEVFANANREPRGLSRDLVVHRVTLEVDGVADRYQLEGDAVDLDKVRLDAKGVDFTELGPEGDRIEPDHHLPPVRSPSPEA
jgi:hypothetical protein